jgi:hypothetical protein
MTDAQKPRGRGRPRATVVAAGSAEGVAPTTGQTEPAATSRHRSNRPQDKQFIQDAVAAGEIKVWEGHLVWSGRSQDLLHPFQVPPDERRCLWTRQMRDDIGGQILDADRNPLKERCPKWAMIGANICVEHAKGSKAVMEQAREMIAGAAPALVGQLIRDALNNGENATASDRIKAINSLLDRFGLRGGIEVGPDMPAWREIMDELGKETGVTE